MKKSILVADKDESLQHAFTTVFSKDHFEIIYASTGKEVEKIADRIRPDVYIINVDLPKTNGIEVYKNLQKKRVLDTATFFFLKDETDSTELLGYQADGILEKPLNFFKVYETVTKEEEIIDLTDLIEEKVESAREPLATPLEEDEDSAKWAFSDEPVKNIGTVNDEIDSKNEPEIELGETEDKPMFAQKESVLMASLETRLKDAMEGIVTGGAVERAEHPAIAETEAIEEHGESHQQLEEQLKVVLNQALEEAALKLSARLAPVLTHYVEDYVKKMLLEIAEKVIKEEIDKLLKESAG
jgi:response regulator RpfG family c-di-GMP phosphodiesterase